MPQLELSRYLTSEAVEMKRSDIKFASYNPRKIDEEARKTLRKGIKKFGMVGGVVVNSRTGNTLVSGHQRLSILDELQKYDPETHENDYLIRVDVVDIDEKAEKELNILSNNPNAQGTWDFDALREMIPNIDYKDAGLTEADLHMIGVDFLFKTEEENNLSKALSDMMSPVEEQHRQEVADRAELRQQQREEIRKAQEEANAQQSELDNMSPEEREEAERLAKVNHMKDVKQQVKDGAIANAQDQDAYIMVSFDNWENKRAFCEAFGLDVYSKFVKGEAFERLLMEGADDSLNDE